MLFSVHVSFLFFIEDTSIVLMRYCNISIGALPLRIPISFSNNYYENSLTVCTGNTYTMFLYLMLRLST